MEIELTREERDLLKDILERTSHDLREEVYKTESTEWKTALKAREQVLTGLRAKIESV